MTERRFAVLTLLPGLVLVPWAVLHMTPAGMVSALLLSAAFVALALQTAELPNGIYFNSASPLAVAVMALAQPQVAALVPLVGILIASRRVGRSWLSTFSNLSIFATCYAAGSLAYHAIETPGVSPLQSPWSFAALVAAFTVNEGLNALLVGVRVALGRKLPVWQTVWNSLLVYRNWGHHAINLVAIYMIDLTQRGVWLSIPLGVVMLTGVYGALRFFMERDRLTRAASYDALTGIFNRAELQRLCAEAERVPAIVALIDMDGLKTLNDLYGHDVGDEALVDLAHTLSRAVGSRGTVYRFGGDEFVVYAGQPDTQVEHDLVEALVRFGQRWQSRGASASLGTAYVPAHAATLSEGLLVADRQMYAQRKGRRKGAREVL